MTKPTTKQIREVMRHLSKLGARKGGIARAASLTSEQRRDIARQAGLASGLARGKAKAGDG